MPILLFIIAVLVIVSFLIIGKHNNKIISMNREEIANPSTRRNRKTRTPRAFSSGPYLVDVYVYDGRPLEDRPPMSELILEVMYKPARMKSIYTGRSWSGFGCVTYNGNPIGFVSTYDPYFKWIEALTQKRRGLAVHAKVDGYNPNGWPYVKLKMPEPATMAKIAKGL